MRPAHIAQTDGIAFSPATQWCSTYSVSGRMLVVILSQFSRHVNAGRKKIPVYCPADAICAA